MDLLSLLLKIPDPPRHQGQKYSHVTVVLYSILVMLAGAISYRRIYGFVAIHLVELNAAFPTVALGWAISRCSIGYILHKSDPGGAERAPRCYGALLCAKPKPETTAMAIAGRVLRGGFDAFAHRKAVHLLCAFATHEQIILRHLVVSDKSI